MASSKQFIEPIAYDISKDVIDQGEVINIDAIEQSIENILMTSFGERLFLPQFGSILTNILFENINAQNGEQVLTQILTTIETWEDRIILFKNDARLQIKNDENAIILTLPYQIKKSRINSSFQRKIIL